jgi:cystathionine beta-synthase
MIDEGLLAQHRYGDLRDLIARRAEDGSVVSVEPQDTLLTAFQRMRLADVQQLPVLDAGVLVGVIDESDLLLHVQEEASRYAEPVQSAMSTALQTLAPDAGIPALRRVLDGGLVAIIADGSGFHGLITRFDLLNHLRNHLKKATR